MDYDERRFGSREGGEALGALFGMALFLLLLGVLLYVIFRAVLYTVLFLAVAAERLLGRRLLPSIPGREGPPPEWLR